MTSQYAHLHNNPSNHVGINDMLLGHHYSVKMNYSGFKDSFFIIKDFKYDPPRGSWESGLAAQFREDDGADITFKSGFFVRSKIVSIVDLGLKVDKNTFELRQLYEVEIKGADGTYTICVTEILDESIRAEWIHYPSWTDKARAGGFLYSQMTSVKKSS